MRFPCRNGPRRTGASCSWRGWRIPRNVGKWRQRPSSAIGPGRQGRVSAGPDGQLVIPCASRARASTAKICIFIHGEIPLPKRPSKDCREPFLEGLADTPKRGESGANGHRARYGLAGKTRGRRPGSAASDSLRFPRSRNAPAGVVVHICIFICFAMRILYLYPQ